jgi:hypothetical protein
MKSLTLALIGLSCAGATLGQTASPYTNFIRQVQMPTGVQWDASVASAGERISPLPVDIGGARFELWSVKSTPLTSYLLDTKFVSAYAPSAEVVIRSEDPHPGIPRTRADRPFSVDITLSGLLTGTGNPVSSTAVKLLRHVQSYGTGGTGEDVNRSLATLESQSQISTNGTQTLNYTVNSIPGADRSKVVGEERFSVFSLADALAPESQLASRYIQIWPVADGSISGITPGAKLRVQLPKLTLTLNDLYPESHTYLQIYRGNPVLGTQGTLIPGSSLVTNSSTPVSRVLLLTNYDAVITGDGLWTMELLTETPFGTDRLDHITFEIDRTIELNGTFTTIE